MIRIDDLLLNPPAQRHLCEILEQACRRGLGDYDRGTFTPARGRERAAADHLEAAALHLADVVAGPDPKSILNDQGLQNDARPTVMDRMLRMCIARHLAERKIRYGRVRLDGVVVQSPDTPAPMTAELVVR